MATPSQIQALLATARVNALDWDDKAAILSWAIDQAFNNNGEVVLPAAIVGADGASTQRMTIEAASALLVKWKNLGSAGGGGVVGQYVEFR